jgi:2-haloacid dehalogenase
VHQVKALLFDVFGTLVDWRGGVAREAESHLAPLGYRLDWLRFAEAWRMQYEPGMEEVRSGKIPFSKLDVIHRRMLERILPAFAISELPGHVAETLTHAWHWLDAWPDVAPAFEQLRRRFLLAPVSNGNISLMVDLARRNELRFDAILGAEIAGDYKPKPKVYLSAAAAFDVDPAECLMVSAASHTGDIAGAKAAGLKVASISRPQEYPGALAAPELPVDFTATDLLDLARQLHTA